MINTSAPDPTKKSVSPDLVSERVAVSVRVLQQYNKAYKPLCTSGLNTNVEESYSEAAPCKPGRPICSKINFETVHLMMLSFSICTEIAQASKC